MTETLSSRSSLESTRLSRVDDSCQEMYDSDDNYSNSEDSGSSDTDLSDNFADSDDDPDDRMQEEFNIDPQMNSVDNPNACTDDAQEVSCNSTYPKSVLIRTLLILSVKIRKNLDNESVQYITGLIDALSDKSLSYTSLYHFKKIIDNYSFPFEVHHVCPTCGLYIGVVIATVEEPTLKCKGCNVDISSKENKQSGNFFLYSPLRRQLEEFCKTKKLANEGVTYTFNGNVYNKKVRILVGVCDSVERPNLRCSKTFRGKYGCGLCKHQAVKRKFEELDMFGYIPLVLTEMLLAKD
ncbi:hypothetical protein KQX54_000418 [Cotesia glomerata]|uniref:Uncharacterized protein n=1 Tax=Cotesia glomerata TaxID=32391 RepID=A0AAV7ILS8_COTGL|nr:hypothetical protein KQX54_000418 [Cotesia glomerata]